MAYYPKLPQKLPEFQKLIYLKTNVAGYFFDAFLSIDHTSKLNITEHPIESGANVSDHAFLEPKELTMEIGMSDCMKSIVSGQFKKGNSRSVTAYRTLIELQAQKVPLQIYTRLGIYRNMLIETISAPDDYKTRYGLNVTVTFREVFIAKTQTVKISARPQVTNTTNTGNIEPVQANESIAYQLKKILTGG